MRTRAQAADPLALDVPYLATTYGLPESEIHTLVDAPTSELVISFLASVISKEQEFDTLKAEKLKVDVELENTVRTTESKIKAQKAQVSKHAKEVEELRIKLNEAQNAREALSSELEELRSASSGSTAETTVLRQRIETLEASNRDALALVESKSAEKDRVATELSEQHTKLLTLRREISALEEKNQSLENAASSQKFKEQSMQQEIELLKRNNDWNSNELQTRNQEHAKFRKERNARIAGLQRELEDSSADVEALKRTETTLRQRLNEVQGKADEAFTRIAGLQEEFARKEQDFKVELDSTKRLAELQAQNAATHKARLQEIQGQVDEIKESAADEIGRLQAEIETERSDREQAERRVAELELNVERLERQPRLSRPRTPLRNGAADPTTPGRLGSGSGSPSALPGTLRKSVGGLSFTQLYSQYTETKEELANEQRRTQKLSQDLDELLNNIESRAPEIQELKDEQHRLEQEVLNFSRMLDDTKEIRDNAVKEAERYQGEAAAAVREGDVLRQQLRDLSAQIKILLVEIQSRDQGLGEMTAQERFELERAARGELADGDLQEMTSTGRLISERLVIFRNVDDLQTKNADLVRITRQLGEQMEGEEARAKARQSAEYAQENEELKQTVSRYKDELQATATQIDSYMKERDMFRRMLQHRGQLPADADLQGMFGNSVGPITPHRNGSMPPPTPRSKDVEDLNKLLKEQQSFFDQYRNESSTDRRMLKEQVDTLAREKNTLQADIARAQSQVTLASERYEMLQGNFAALGNENGELQKRSQQLAESAAKQDLRTQQVAEELVEARSHMDRLRNENANARAEKELWKRIETRLTEDNKVLMEERSRLNKLVTDLQNLQNERELAESENRRRLQARAESLESELADAKKKLEVEAEEARKSALRREYEENQSRTRIDDLVKSLGNVREELVAAKTAKDQLQGRVEELKIELRSAEEKVVALQPRPSTRPQPQENGQQASNDDEDDLPVEQRLALEVSELRKDLELARNELEAARQQVEQYRSIAQSTEDELASFNETSDQYKEETDRIFAEKDDRIKVLEQKVEDLNVELQTTNAELSELRAKAQDHDRVLDEHKASFESELNRLKDDSERYAAEKKLYQQDLKAQAEIAQQAQQSYEDELLKHAEAARSLQSVRKEYNDLRTETAGIRAEADASKASLERSEESWHEQKDRFEHELEDLQRRREDVVQQNKLLHQQMEAFSAELGTLRSGRIAAPSGEDSSGITGTPANDSNSLQEVIKFLRREKEIVDVQYELSIQESKRLQQQLDYAHGQLEETRQKLADERRQSSDRSANEGSTNKLMQTINELNLFRESATTLRNEARQARERLEDKTREVERLVAEAEPIRGRIIELETEIEGKDGDIKLLQEDRDRWRERTQNIISKYDRVDPAELEELKQQLTNLKAENERLADEQTPLKEQIEGFEARINEAKDQATAQLSDRLAKFKEQAKEQNRKQNDKARQLNDDLTAVRAEKDKVASDLQAAQTELETARSALQEAQSHSSAEHSAEVEAVRTELEQTKIALSEAQANMAVPNGNEHEDGQIHEDTAGSHESAALQSQLSDATNKAQENANHAEALANEVQTLQARVGELEAQITSLQEQLEIAQAVEGEPGELPSEASAKSQVDSTVVENLRRDLVTAQQEVETLRTNASIATTQTDPTSGSDEVATSAAAQVAEEVAKVRREMDEQHSLAVKQMEEDHDQRIESMKNNLRRQLKEGREKLRVEITQELVTQHSAELQNLRDEHDTAITQLKQEHQAAIERLVKDGAAAVGKAEGAASSVKTEDASPAGEISETQMLDLVKTNPRMKQIVANNIRKGVAAETEKLTKTITDKDAEITFLKEAQTSATTDANKEEELARQLEAAKKEKETAVKQAEAKAEMKAKVQLSQRDALKFKVDLVKKAAQETPDKAVKEVWDVVDKTKMPPKPASVGNVSSAASPATKPASQQPQAPSSPVNQTPEQIEQSKLRARQERFGTVTAPTGIRPPSSSGLPTSAIGGTFGQPSTLPQATRRASTAVDAGSSAASSLPNPQAQPFNPQRSVTGIPRGAAGSQLPRGGGGGMGRGNIAVQGTASQRGGGGAQPGLPRGGGSVRGRGGGAVGASRGGGLQQQQQQQNAGTKRAHDGTGTGGGVDKRQKSEDDGA